MTIIYCDGACSGNPGPGGWGAIVFDGKNVVELGGGRSSTTNNQMELTAAIEALRKANGPVVVYTDSTYVIRGITAWVHGWRRNGWKTAEGNEVQNQTLWEELYDLARSKKPDWKYVRGHTGVPGNERCDEIAVDFSKGLKPGLFEGSVAEYHFDLSVRPKDEPLPEMKNNSGPKAKPYSYLSLLGGRAARHGSWPECERRVKGQSGAKFKKAMSADEELEILKSWGVNPKDVE